MNFPSREGDHSLPTPVATASANDTAGNEVSSLLRGILADMQRLLMQHLDLLHQEIREDFRKTKEAFLTIGIAGILGLIGGILLIPTLIGLLSWAFPEFPWWGWCGILAGILMILAPVLYFIGKKRLESFNPMPEKSAESVKENLKWIGNQVTTLPK